MNELIALASASVVVAEPTIAAQALAGAIAAERLARRPSAATEAAR